MLTKGSDTFAFDPANRLSASTMGGVFHLPVRRDGERMERVAGSVTTRFVQDINRTLPNVLAETDGSGTITSYYVYGLDLVSKVLPTERLLLQLRLPWQHGRPHGFFPDSDGRICLRPVREVIAAGVVLPTRSGTWAVTVGE